MPIRTIDLCAGIGGVRKGFERTGYFENVVSAEIDKFACLTYEHLYHENPYKYSFHITYLILYSIF